MCNFFIFAYYAFVFCIFTYYVFIYFHSVAAMATLKKYFQGPRWHPAN